MTALESGTLLSLSRHDFDALRTANPAIDRLLVLLLAERLRATSELAVELLLSPETRVWRRLVVLAEAYGSQIRISQDASALGTTTSSTDPAGRHH